MNHPRPSASTLAAIFACQGKLLTAAALPRGEWIEYEERLPGYAINQLLLVFDDNTSLLLWSEQVDYGPEPWHEGFVMAAESIGAHPEPLNRRHSGANQGFEIAPPLQAVFAGHRLACIETFVRASDIYPSNADDYLPSDSLRAKVGEHVVEFATEGSDVLPLTLVLRSPGFPPFTTKPTGKRELLSHQRVHLERPSTPRGDA